MRFQKKTAPIVRVRFSHQTVRVVVRFLPARRYASAGTSYMVMCLSVYVCHKSVLSKRMNESSWFGAWELSSTYPTLYFMEILVTPK